MRVKSPPQTLRTFAIAALSLALGVYLQHRWPLGLIRDRLLASPPAPVEAPQESINRVAPSRRLVLVLAGQSNAANYGESHTTAGPGVYAFYQDKLWLANDPLPGADGIGGSQWPALGARIVAEGAADAVVFAPIAQGSSRVDEWAPTGRLYPSLLNTLDRLTANGLPPDFILWQQGESEGGRSDATGRDYADNFRRLVGAIALPFPRTRWLVARTALLGDNPINLQIRAAQIIVVDRQRIFAGPDTDQLGPDFRRDGVHFAISGQERVATLWWDSLRPILSASSPSRK